MINVTCGCGAQFQVPDERAGATGTCTSCGASITAPSAGGAGAPRARAAAGAVGEGGRLGSYVLERRLGGGASQVFLARSDDGRQVALKVMPHAMAKADPTAGKRFLRAAQSLFGLQHPNVVRYLDAGEDLGAFYVVMEYVAGESLAALRDERGGRLSEEELVPAAIGVAKALGCLAERGLVHRNVQPSHVVLGAGGEAKLVGFGLVRPGDAEAGPQLTVTGTLLGDAHYVAPERLLDESLDSRADLFSLGVTLFELLAGSRPFDDPVPSTVLSKIMQDPTPRLIERSPGTSRGLCAVVERLLEKRPDDRYQTGDELVADLEAIRSGDLKVGLPPNLVARRASASSAAPSGGGRTDPIKIALVALAVVVVVQLAVIAALLAR